MGTRDKGQGGRAARRRASGPLCRSLSRSLRSSRSCLVSLRRPFCPGLLTRTPGPRLKLRLVGRPSENGGGPSSPFCPGFLTRTPGRRRKLRLVGRPSENGGGPPSSFCPGLPTEQHSRRPVPEAGLQHGRDALPRHPAECPRGPRPRRRSGRPDQPDFLSRTRGFLKAQFVLSLTRLGQNVLI